MLKALEIIGFKSFAERTRFEFPEGITVVVGPNGSGKSNVVDAIKWVLGEQSARSLRGKEMADVIFKGSGTTGRKPLNSAEATIVFDNADGKLAYDAAEIAVTRRVYRSGEGEYMINRQACRLKDIRDLFRGTGMGADAYSLIEQGKVDQLLQASPRDRRTMFEEAAGISRFKAKKVETQRRLERVQQNVDRLADIVEEVSNRLQSVRNQASKARKYREASQRLRELRTEVGRSDYRRFSQQVAEKQTQIDSQRQQISELSASIAAGEQTVEKTSQQSRAITEKIDSAKLDISSAREVIAAAVATMDHGWERMTELEQRIAAAGVTQRRWADRRSELQKQIAQLAEEVAVAETERDASLQATEQLAKQLAEATAEKQNLQESVDAVREQRLQISQTHAVLTSEEESLRQQTVKLVADAESIAEEHQTAENKLATFKGRLAEETRHLETATQNHASAAAALKAAREEIESTRGRLDEARDRRAALQGRLSGARERARVLEELERSCEGLGDGVRDLLEQSRDQSNDTDNPLRRVHGLVADLIRVDVDLAPCIDAALGDASQFVVIDHDALDQLLLDDWAPAGRAVLVPLGNGPSSLQKASPADADPPTQLSGVIGRAGTLVESEPEYQPLCELLLGNCWIVETLDQARKLSHALGPAAIVVTKQGERVDRGGIVALGQGRLAAGLISRRSQLRALSADIAGWENSLRELEQQFDADRKQFSEHEEQLKDFRAARDAAAAELQTAKLSVDAANNRLEVIQKEAKKLGEQTVAADAAVQENEQALATTRDKLRSSKTELELCEQRQEETNGKLAEVSSKELALRTEHEQHRATSAAASQRYELVVEKHRAAVGQAEQLNHSQAEAKQEQISLAGQHVAAQLDWLKAGEERNLHQLVCERQQTLCEGLRQQLKECHAVTQTQTRALQADKRAADQLAGEQHQLELEVVDAQRQLDALAQRLRDDYGIELADLHDEGDNEQARADRQAVDLEIESLRQQINRIGAVNLHALAELDELEERYDHLHGQYRDLVDSKEVLDRIISKINVDSRKLYLETLEAVRVNFQALFRRAFGGGRADLVLEEGVDVLEAGVEILANPPGKPSFDNSLLSGGEKALVAVSLLLAIFQYRPSPFCVLDEVDAPFDEANVGRFVDVLNAFLNTTKFVVVTHSKKTMTAATTLYGVTMQENGVSKRVAVRFDDVSEDGHISDDAIRRDEEEAA